MVFTKGHKKGMYGKKHNKETIEKMRINNDGFIKKGQNLSKKTEFKKGRNPWNKGKRGFKMEEDTKKKISKGIIQFYDDNGRVGKINKLLRVNSKWKIWRELIFIRDNFTCQNPNCSFCNNKIGVFLHPHHIKPLSLFPELAFVVDNGITYCQDFHLKSGLHKNIQKLLNERRDK